MAFDPSLNPSLQPNTASLGQPAGQAEGVPLPALSPGPPPENPPRRAIALDDEDAAELAQLWKQNVQQSESDAAVQYNAVKRARTLMGGKDSPSLYIVPKGWENPSRDVVNFCGRARPTLISNVLPQLVPSPLVFTVEVEGRVQGGKSAKQYQTLLERFYQQILDEDVVNFKLQIERALDLAYTDGVAFCMVPWLEERRIRTAWTYTRTVEHDSQTLEQVGEPTEDWESRRELQTVTDSPILIPMACCDGDGAAIVGTYPAAQGDLQRSSAVFCRWEMSGDECIQFVECGLFDKNAVSALKDKVVDEGRRSGDDKVREIANSVPPDKFFASRRFIITEYQTLYLPNGERIPQEWRFFFSETWGLMLHANPSPWFSGQRNIFSLSAFPDKSGIFADSIGDRAGDIQIAMTNILRLIINRGRLMVNPELGIPRGTPQDDILALQRRRGEGALIELYEDTLKNLSPLDAGANPMFLLQLYQELKRDGEEATGMSNTRFSDLNRGQPTNLQREMASMESSATINNQVSSFSNGLSRFGNCLLKGMVYQYQGRDNMIRIWQKANPDSGPDDMQNALALPHTLTPACRTQPGSPNQRQQQEMALFQASLQNSYIMNNPKTAYYVFRQYFAALGENQPENRLGTEEEYTAQVMQQQQQAAQAAQEKQQMEQAALMAKAGGGQATQPQPPGNGGMPPEMVGAQGGDGGGGQIPPEILAQMAASEGMQ